MGRLALRQRVSSASVSLRAHYFVRRSRKFEQEDDDDVTETQTIFVRQKARRTTQEKQDAAELHAKRRDRDLIVERLNAKRASRRVTPTTNRYQRHASSSSTTDSPDVACAIS